MSKYVSQALTAGSKEKYDLEFPDGPTSRPYASGLHAAIGKEYVPFFEACAKSRRERPVVRGSEWFP